ncbi:MAG: radical SAM protein [Oscillospiraceae bacterium]|nr:radical SAM protein [Oscillospiraceae bacterium]
MHFVDAKGILGSNNGINMYRGCTHGCIYCDARSKCYVFTHRFEDVEVKQNAPVLLEKALKSKRKKCMIGTGSMCDPYMHCEEEIGITRKCLETIERYGFGVTVHTKSARILRDLELLKSINKKSKAVVQMTLTTADEKLCKILEPNVSTTKERFETLKILRDNGIPTVVWLCPILPFINDTEENISAILDMCIEAKVKGIICFNMGVTLREGDREYFYAALDKYFPGLKEIYIRKYGNSYDVTSDNNRELMKLFMETCYRNGIMYTPEKCFEYLREYPEKDEQLSLF